MKDITPPQLAELIRQSRRVVALTGAGISVESGIPDFRSKGGLWERFDPWEYATIQAFEKNPAKVWVMLKEMDEILRHARPNPAHYALAELEARGHLMSVITQNVDNLHQAAGSQNIIEYHGNAHRFVCLTCRGHWPRAALDFDQTPLYCYCGGLIKPDVVFFGEAIPEAALYKANDLVINCDLLLIIGTSAEVAPANILPEVAKNNGAIIVESNLAHTRLSLYLSDYFLQGPAGRMWPLVLEQLKQITTQ
ncbi:MAG: NAD-dependent deacylase [Deltaproteobacteria bacterium]|nr:NAD-dependent deacylase [Desulfitobacteriaceae bacterium]MDI6854619.1 NAD-dependent deacylase [Deltaproteobacteria bacterium]